MTDSRKPTEEEEIEAMYAVFRAGRREHWVRILWRVLLVELVLIALLLLANGESLNRPAFSEH